MVQIRTAMQRAQRMTKEGWRSLRQKLQTLKEDYNHLRQKLAEDRQTQISDDPDLIELQMHLSFLQAEIEQLQHTLRNCKVIEDVSEDHRIQIGSKIKLLAEDQEINCMLVSSLEADPSEGKISDQSPLGRALVGKMANALVEVYAPKKHLFYRVVGIENAAG